MQNFQGSAFSIVLPDDADDASSYCFTFPAAGELPPNLTIRSDSAPPDFDLATHVSDQRDALAGSTENLVLLNELQNRRGTWTYVVSIVEWGPENNRIRQKQTFVHVRGPEPQVHTLTATDNADNFKQSEAIINQVIKSFKPREN